MADKFLINESGTLKEKEAITTSAGASDSGKVVAVSTTGKFDMSVMPDGIGADIKVCPAYENLSAGDLVNLFLDSGVIKARKADASGGVAKMADGFVIAAVGSSSNASVYLSGIVSGLTSLTIGANYFLSATAGGVVSTAPTTATYITQYIGKAISTTEIKFVKGEPIIRA